MRLRVAFGIGAVIAIATACQLIAGINDRTIYDSGNVQNPCGAPDLPPLPAGAPPDPATPLTLTAALSKIMVGSSDGGPYYGFNLDKTCTCQGGAKDSCILPGDASPHCDDDGGIDNYARHAFEQINSFAESFGQDGGIITEQRFNTALATGLSGAIIEISNYNGQSDDANVRVTIYGSQGYEGYPDASPQLNGSDRWIIDPSSTPGSTDNAYVANYTLVAIGLNFPIIVGSAITQPVTIQLDEGVIRAHLDMTGSTLNKITDGVLGGRWDPAKFLPSLQAVPDPISFSGTFLCGDASAITYPLLKKTICANTDINRSSAGDNGGLCNSVSMGLGFEAVPAIKGKTGTYVDAGQPCGPNWTDSCSN